METFPEILLQPNIIKPLHGLNPRTIFGQKWWDYERQIAYASTDYKCLACGVDKNDAEFHQWLEAHEDYRIDFKRFRYELKRIIPLCHACHNFIHDGRLKILWNTGKISPEKYMRITGRGEKILSDSGLPQRNNAWWADPEYYPQLFPEKVGTWNKWHLLIDGKEYYSKFDDYDAWAEFYGRKKW